MITITFKSLQDEFPKPGDQIAYITSEGGITSIRFSEVVMYWMKEEGNCIEYIDEECEGYTPLTFLSDGECLDNYLLEGETDLFYWTYFKEYYETTKEIYGKEPEPYDYLRRFLFDPIVK